MKGFELLMQIQTWKSFFSKESCKESQKITKKSWNFVYILAKQIFRQFDEIFAEILTKISKC